MVTTCGGVLGAVMALLLAAPAYSVPAVCVSEEATVIALLALHEGPNCSVATLRGAQQEAAVMAAARTANTALSKDGMRLVVRVFDSCSAPRDAVSATLRALASFPHACLQPPMLLGMIGPDDGPSLQAVQRVTRVFNLYHVLPFDLGIPGPIYVTSASHEDQLQAVTALAARLQWPEVTLLHTGDAVTSQLALKLTRRLCVLAPPLELPASPDSEERYSEILRIVQKHPQNPALLLAGSMAPVTHFLEHLSHAQGAMLPPAYLLVARSAGVLPQLRSLALPGALLLLQHSQSQLADEEDTSVVPLSHAVALFAAALTVVSQARCQGRHGSCPVMGAISPDQWRNILAVAMTSADNNGPASNKIRFNIDIPSRAEIFLKLAASENIIQVGQVDAGKLNMSEGFSLHPAAASGNNMCWSGAVVSTTTSTTAMPTLNGVIAGSDYYQMVSYLSGIASGLLLVFSVCMVLVYRSFIPRRTKSSSASSVVSAATRD